MKPILNSPLPWGKSYTGKLVRAKIEIQIEIIFEIQLSAKIINYKLKISKMFANRIPSILYFM